MRDWIILRCSGKATLGLAASLAEAGFDVWTPAERRLRLVGRDRKRAEQVIPLMPTFLFADADDTHALLALSRNNLPYRKWDSELRRMVAKGHAHFSVFRQSGEVPTIPDSALAALRRAEARTAPKQAVRVFGVGEAVKLAEGGFAGLEGITEGTRGQFTFVRFAKFPVAVQIATALLHKTLDANSGHSVENGTSEEAGASKAA